MKKKTLFNHITFAYVLLVAGLFGCSGQQKFKKPFIIINKCTSDCINTYTFEDANGKRQNFDDDISKYSIGDTIN